MDFVKLWKIFTVSGILIVGFILIYAVWMAYVKRRAKKLCGHYVHTVPGKPFIGNTAQLTSLRTTGEVWEFITDYSNKYGQGVLVWLFHIPWLFIRDLDVVEKILLSTEAVEKSHIYTFLTVITNGVFVAAGNRWRKLRKKCNLTFGPRQLDMLYNDMNEFLPITVDVLKKKTGKYINILTFMTPFFFDTVTRTHFGGTANEQINRRYQTTEGAAKSIELTVQNRIFKPQNHLDSIFQLTRTNCFIKHVTREGRNDIKKHISERLRNAELEKANNLYEDKKRIYYVDVVKDALEELNIKPSINNLEETTADMMVAASDTTSVAVSAVFYYLALYPDIQEKVYQEVLTVFGENRTKELNKDDLNKLEYLGMVIKETLRHTSPAGIVRELDKDLDVGKYIIPKRTNIYLTMKSIHKNPEYYERPNEFYPDHFLPEAVKKRPKIAYLAFSYGPRNCPGMAYAYITMKGVISTVVRNFKFDTNIPLKDIKYKIVLMQEHINGYYVKLTER